MDFSIHGPFDVPRQNGGIDTTASSLRAFWDTVDKTAPGLSTGCGCYVFILRKKVHYVGMAQRQNFASECFAPHKYQAYDRALRTVSGVPKLVFCARRTAAGRLSKPATTSHRDVAFLEALLIGYAVQRNRDLQNVKGTRLLADLHVPGVINSRRGELNSHAVQQLRKALGI